MLDLNGLAEQKSKSSGEDQSSWGTLLAKSYKALSSHAVKDGEFEELVEACESQKQLALLTREFFSFTQKDSQKRSAYQLFIKEVEDSDFDLPHWIQALEKMYEWLDKENKTAKLDEIIGYLNCCASSSTNQLSRKSFAELCVEFLGDYGFEKADSIS